MKNKSKLIMQLIFTLGLCLVIPFLARIIREVIEVYNFNFSLIPEGYIKQNISLETYKGFFDFKNPVNGLGLALIILFVVLSIINNINSLKPEETYEQEEEYGSHGTSRWQTRKEIKTNYYQDKLGWFLGSMDNNKTYDIGMDAAYHPVDGDLNMQVVVVGPPGSKKTTGFVLNNIFHICDVYKDKEEKADLIITDPKPELYPLTANYLEKNGYDVKVLDFIELEYGDCLNPLDFINDDKTMMQIAQGYIDAVSGAAEGKGGGDQEFWNDQEAQVLAALMGFVKQIYPKEKQNFTELAKILTSEDVSDIDSAKVFFENNNIKGAAAQLWNNFLMLADSERTRANILGGLAEKLKLFAIEGIQNITNKTTIDISKLGAKKEKPMAIFIFMPAEDKTFSPIINVCITSILKQLYKTSRKTNSKLEMPVYFILEEMANIGKIPGIKEMLGTMRGLRIYPMMIWQSLAQMKDMYKEGFENIMSQCDTKVYLGVNDPFTAKYCSDILGDTTIKIQGISKRGGEGLLTVDQKSESRNFQQRKLYLPDECMRLSRDKMIISQISRNPVLMYKVQYKYWEYSLCESKNIFDLKPMKKIEDVNIITHCEKSIEKDIVNYKDEKQFVIRDNHSKTLETSRIDESILEKFGNDFDIEI